MSVYRTVLFELTTSELVLGFVVVPMFLSYI